MANKVKKLLIALFGTLVFLFVGVFFVGCGVNTSKIYLSADKEMITLNAGDETSVTITINNYQKGFSNKIKVSPRDDGKSHVFTTSDPIKISNNTFKFNITALAGGTGELVVKTLEGGKECKISVSVNQYSTSMTASGETLYVSNKTPFVPNGSNFVFDPNTTDFNLKHYLLRFEEDVQNLYDVTTASLSKIEDGKATLQDQKEAEHTYDTVELDKVALQQIENQEKICTYLNGQQTGEFDAKENFYLLSVYEYSLLNHAEGEKILSAISVVNVLPDLQIKTQGRYLKTSETLEDISAENDIIIVPNTINLNNNRIDKSQYLIRIGMNGNNLSPIKVDLKQSNFDVIVDNYIPTELEKQGEEVGKTYKYILISQNAQTQSNTNLSIEIYYILAKDIKDESINKTVNLNIKTLVAPTRITINGTESPETFNLYNFYLAPEYGWNNLLVDVVSDFSTSPDFTGLYFDFEENKIDLLYKNQVINPLVVRNFTKKDLQTPFQIRGKNGISPTEGILKIYVINDEIFGSENYLESKPISYNVVEGAGPITVEPKNFDKNGKEDFTYYINVGEKTLNLNGIVGDNVYTNNIFKYLTVELSQGTNCVRLEPYLSVGEDGKNYYYTKHGDKYCLNLKVNPLCVGQGTYLVRLDNGMPAYITFQCIDALDLNKTPVVLYSDDSLAVANLEYTSEGDKQNQFSNNVMKLEILNPSTRDEIIAGQVVNLQVVANYNDDGTGIKYEYDLIHGENDVVDIVLNATGKGLYKITTLKNGKSRLVFNITGKTAQNFVQDLKSAKFNVDIIAYSVARELTLKNDNGDLALNSSLYYGNNVPIERRTLQFYPEAKNSNSYNFQQFIFTDDFYQELVTQIQDGVALEALDDNSTSAEIWLSAGMFSRFVTTKYVNEVFGNKFIYFYAYNDQGRVKPGGTTTTVRVSVDDKNYNFEVNFFNGLMFYMQDTDLIVNNQTYTIHFDNHFEIGNYASFDLTSFEYENFIQITHGTVIRSFITQRDSTKEFDARIFTQSYQEVISISRSNGASQLDFDSDTLSQSISVFTYPITATNSGIKVDIIQTNGNPHEIVKATIDDSTSGNGVYNIKFSCEEFYNKVLNGEILENNKVVELQDIKSKLTARAYIYPNDWGKSYMDVVNPVVIDIHFRNGNIENPLLLKTAEDVIKIGLNEQKLKSHYEIRNTIDMAGVGEGISPIGFIGNDLFAFTGTIVGTTSQAGLINVNIFADEMKSTPFKFYKNKTNDNCNYAGLFAEIGSQAVLENFTVSGSINLNISGKTYASLLTAKNYGTIKNVGVFVENYFDGETYVNSSIESSGSVYFGALAGLNGITFVNGEVIGGEIIQDFTIYDANIKDEIDTSTSLQEQLSKLTYNKDKIDLIYKGKFKSQSSKNIAFYKDYLNLKLKGENAYIGGVVGQNYGNLTRILPSQNYKLYNYSGYFAYTLIFAEGTLNQAYLGGIIGQNSSNISQPIYSKIDNLLVGGEINCLSLTAQGGVGGIIGNIAIDYLNSTLINNISRVFLRGGNAQVVGGIVGKEEYKTSGAESFGEVNYYLNNEDGSIDQETLNKIEAIDDARTAFYSAMIITQRAVANNSSVENEQKIRQTIAVGDHGGKNEKADFKVYSYLKRTLIDQKGNKVTPGVEKSTTEYYGDYLDVAYSLTDVSYTISNFYQFDLKQVENASVDSDMKMSNDDLSAPNLYFMYYFSVSSRVDGNTNESLTPQQQIAEINTFSPSQISVNLYPFVINSQDISIASLNSNLLSIDLNGDISTKGVGLVTLKISSILNVNVEQFIYIYIFNYFNKDSSAYMFYSLKSNSPVGNNNNSTLTILGDNYNRLQINPDYSLDKLEDLQSGQTSNRKLASITANGILKYDGIDYFLDKNKDITAKDDLDNVDNVDERFSMIDISNQTITFWKNPEKDYKQDDRYTLVPILVVEVNNGTGEPYVYYYELQNAKLNLTVKYREVATAITTKRGKHKIQSNGNFDEVVSVESKFKDELVFYEIENEDGEIVQSRMARDYAEVEALLQAEKNRLIDEEGSFGQTWTDFINQISPNLNTNSFGDLFRLKFEDFKTHKDNKFNFNFSLNRDSEKFKNRLEENIFGTYYVTFYASQLKGDGEVENINCTMVVAIEEAEINYVSMRNYSNLKERTIPDQIVVPSQRGLLEISIDPIEAAFERFTITNDQINTSNASFVFMYSTLKDNQTILVEAVNFGNAFAGGFTFTYKDLVKYFEDLDSKEGISLHFDGNIYLAYYIPSVNVHDGALVRFNVEITYGKDVYGLSKVYETGMELVTKLSNYVSLKFNDKQKIGDYYYLAKGLSYEATLEYFGFVGSDITIETSSPWLTYDRIGDNLIFNVLQYPESNYNSNEPGYKVEILVSGEKMVDGELVYAEETIELYLMEYVFNYNYEVGVNEDIVEGMQNGVINIAVGTPYQLKLSILDYMECQNIMDTNAKMQLFVNSLTKNAVWKVYYEGKIEQLETGKSIEDKNGYFAINSFTFTPRQLYGHESDAYHFSISGHYVMSGGEYVFVQTEVNSNQIYTEFSFDVHAQSSRESRIPVKTYQDLLDLQDGQWAILLNNIQLPSKEKAAELGIEQFRPLEKNLGGLDGNGYAFEFAGNYDFEEPNVGIFANITNYNGELTVMQNIKILLAEETIFNMSSNNYNIGLLTPQNDGIISNCEVSQEMDANLIVRANSSTSTIAGLVGTNNGYITNSRSKISITGNGNISGFVGTNNRHISSSYFIGNINNLTSTQNTAGFALNNSGQIYTSYASGTPDKEEIYYTGEKANSVGSLTSRYLIAGFVFTNGGNIADCYSNVKLQNPGNSTYISGFVYNNSGEIDRSFSTSLMTTGRTSDYGFVKENNSTETGGVIRDCFRLVDADKKINVGLGDDPKGDDVFIEHLSLSDLENPESEKLKNVLKNYIISNDKNADGNYIYGTGNLNGVWFFGSGNNVLGENYNRRIELVAPNIIAKSQMNLIRTENVVENGVEDLKYIYEYNPNFPTLGTAKNPILIDNAKTFEEYIANETDNLHNNYAYYRLIGDINFEENVENSETYKTNFKGYFEGNFMDISANILFSSEQGEYAGLFAEIGGRNMGDIGTVMNFNYNPSIVAFAGYKVVGSVAGVVDSGKVFNINVTVNRAITGDQEFAIVEGKNIVGGVIGLAVGNYSIKNVGSQFGAKARFQNGDDETFNENGDLNLYSFAGSVAGVLGGKGSLVNVESNSKISVAASKAGFMFGLIDKDANVSTLKINISQDSVINGYSYAGFVAGESAGNVDNVTITSSANDFTNVRNVSKYAIGVGGFAGLISGGELYNIIVGSQNAALSVTLSNVARSSGVENLGGVAGVISSMATLKKITVFANLVGYENVGGVAGIVDCGENHNIVYFEDINVTANLSVLGNKQPKIGVGGLAGEVTNSATINLKTHESDDKYEADNISNEESLKAFYENHFNFNGEKPDLREASQEIKDAYSLMQENLKTNKDDLAEELDNINSDVISALKDKFDAYLTAGDSENNYIKDLNDDIRTVLVENGEKQKTIDKLIEKVEKFKTFETEQFNKIKDTIVDENAKEEICEIFEEVITQARNILDEGIAFVEGLTVADIADGKEQKEEAKLTEFKKKYITIEDEEVQSQKFSSAKKNIEEDEMVKIVDNWATIHREITAEINKFKNLIFSDYKLINTFNVRVDIQSVTYNNIYVSLGAILGTNKGVSNNIVDCIETISANISVLDIEMTESLTGYVSMQDSTLVDSNTQEEKSGKLEIRNMNSRYCTFMFEASAVTYTVSKDSNKIVLIFNYCGTPYTAQNLP